MKKLRWAMDGDFWDVDVSTPRTLESVARPVPGDGECVLPLGLSRGCRLSRPNQIDFFQRFMAALFLPSFAGGPHPSSAGFSLHRVLSLPFSDHWVATLLGQFNLQKFVSSVKKQCRFSSPSESSSSWLSSIGHHLRDPSFYAFGLSSELSLTPDDTLCLSWEQSTSADPNLPRRKALLHHKALEAAWPALFVDKLGTYWDVPLSLAFDLGSVASDSGSSYHVCLRHNSGTPKQFQGNQQTRQVPTSLLPGWYLRSAYSLKRTTNIWTSEAEKLKMVQPFDLFLSKPHVSASGIIGAVATASLGNKSVRLHAEDKSQGYAGFTFDTFSAIFADIFASVSLTAQHGNFQRLFLDLTRFHARLDFPSGLRFLSGTSQVARNLYNSQQPKLETIAGMLPHTTLSLQQQIVGPFSFRVDSGVAVGMKGKKWHLKINEPVFAVEYALQVLGSAKAVAWYSPKHQELMVELRFYET
ncbi:hypothetical protein RJ641_020919 [Dillenia turbinata]|uniref:Protein TRIGALACTOSYLDIACYLGLYCEROL 4, chloroplastic n=1 Tax=Dillenia turbinata TaxID=194707 RepID=A0AAN8UAY0_9MAGN